MNFYSMRDLRTESKTMWADLDRGDEVVLTNKIVFVRKQQKRATCLTMILITLFVR